MECSLTSAPWTSSALFIHTSRYKNKNRNFIRVGLPWTSPTLSIYTPRALFFASEVRTTLATPTRRRTRKNSQGGGLNVELEIFKFMQQSGKPGEFPTKEDLIAAGRTDLVEAALKRGGWLTFGWETDKPKDSRRSSQVNSADISSKSEDATTRHEVAAELQRTPAELVLTKETSLPSRNSKEKLNRTEKTSSKQSLEDFAPSSRSRRAGRRPSKNASGDEEKENSKTPESPNVEASHERWRRKRRKELPPDNTTVKNALDWINDMVQRREQWIMESMSKPSQQTLKTSKDERTVALPRRGSSVKAVSTNALAFQKDSLKVKRAEEAPKESPAQANSFNERLRKLETKLLSTRAALKSGRASLLKGEDKLLQVQRKTGEDYAKAADSLEFRENDIMQTRAELRRTRAQVTALQAKMALELSEARNATQEKQALLEKAEAALKMMRLVRIVWPNAASHVLLTGSFDGWTNKIKMEKSSAGVFVTSLHLYPGRYEVKFIVDGTWRVDPCRPITYADGIENNSITVS